MRETVRGLAKHASLLAAFGMLLAMPRECEAKDRALQDWSRVEGIESTRRIRIVLHDDRAPRGVRKVSGRFASATPHSMTVAVGGGTTRTFRRSEVRKVSVRRPVLKRRKAWGLTFLATGCMLATVFLFQDHTPLGGTWVGDETLRGMGFIVAPAWMLSILGLSHKLIYRSS